MLGRASELASERAPPTFLSVLSCECARAREKEEVVCLVAASDDVCELSSLGETEPLSFVCWRLGLEPSALAVCGAHTPAIAVRPTLSQAWPRD